MKSNLKTPAKFENDNENKDDTLDDSNDKNTTKDSSLELPDHSESNAPCLGAQTLNTVTPAAAGTSNA